MTSVLIAGSRKTTPPMIVHAQRLVRAYGRLGYPLLVGDANGIDAAVQSAARQWGAAIRVYGVDATPRNGKGLAYVRVGKNYEDRDQYMVRQADNIDVIWNGESAGSLAVYAYAQKIGKVPTIRVFDEDGRCWIYTADQPLFQPSLTQTCISPPRWWQRLAAVHQRGVAP